MCIRDRAVGEGEAGDGEGGQQAIDPALGPQVGQDHADPACGVNDQAPARRAGGGPQVPTHHHRRHPGQHHDVGDRHDQQGVDVECHESNEPCERLWPGNATAGSRPAPRADGSEPDAGATRAGVRGRGRSGAQSAEYHCIGTAGRRHRAERHRHVPGAALWASGEAGLQPRERLVSRRAAPTTDVGSPMLHRTTCLPMPCPLALRSGCTPAPQVPAAEPVKTKMVDAPGQES